MCVCESTFGMLNLTEIPKIRTLFRSFVPSSTNFSHLICFSLLMCEYTLDDESSTDAAAAAAAAYIFLYE